MSGYVTLKSGYGISMSRYYIVVSRYNIILRDARYHMVIQNRHRTCQYQDVSSTYISQYNSVSKGLYIAQIPVVQNCQQEKHFGRFNKMESKMGLSHILFEQHVALSSLTFNSSYTKMSYCDVNMLYHDIIIIS